MSAIGYIYCMTNPAFKDGLVKIGLTMRTPEERRRELSTTGVPLPFVVEFAKQVVNPTEKEKSLHLILEEKRINQDREFFLCPVEEVRSLFEMYEGSWWVQEESSPRKQGREEEARAERELQRKLRKEAEEQAKKERARRELEHAQLKIQATQEKQNLKYALERRASQVRRAAREAFMGSLFTDSEDESLKE